MKRKISLDSSQTLFFILPTLALIFKWKNVPASLCFSWVSEFNLRDKASLEAVILKPLSEQPGLGDAGT